MPEQNINKQLYLVSLLYKNTNYNVEMTDISILF